MAKEDQTKRIRISLDIMIDPAVSEDVARVLKANRQAIPSFVVDGLLAAANLSNFVHADPHGNYQHHHTKGCAYCREMGARTDLEQFPENVG